MVLILDGSFQWRTTPFALLQRETVPPAMSTVLEFMVLVLCTGDFCTLWIYFVLEYYSTVLLFPISRGSYWVRVISFGEQ